MDSVGCHRADLKNRGKCELEVPLDSYCGRYWFARDSPMCPLHEGLDMRVVRQWFTTDSLMCPLDEGMHRVVGSPSGE